MKLAKSSYNGRIQPTYSMLMMTSLDDLFEFLIDCECESFRFLFGGFGEMHCAFILINIMVVASRCISLLTYLAVVSGESVDNEGVRSLKLDE